MRALILRVQLWRDRFFGVDVATRTLCWWESEQLSIDDALISSFEPDHARWLCTKPPLGSVALDAHTCIATVHVHDDAAAALLLSTRGRSESADGVSAAAALIAAAPSGEAAGWAVGDPRTVRRASHVVPQEKQVADAVLSAATRASAGRMLSPRAFALATGATAFASLTEEDVDLPAAHVVIVAPHALEAATVETWPIVFAGALSFLGGWDGGLIACARARARARALHTCARAVCLVCAVPTHAEAALWVATLRYVARGEHLPASIAACCAASFQARDNVWRALFAITAPVVPRPAQHAVRGVDAVATSAEADSGAHSRAGDSTGDRADSRADSTCAASPDVNNQAAVVVNADARRNVEDESRVQAAHAVVHSSVRAGEGVGEPADELSRTAAAARADAGARTQSVDAAEATGAAGAAEDGSERAAMRDATQSSRTQRASSKPHWICPTDGQERAIMRRQMYATRRARAFCVYTCFLRIAACMHHRLRASPPLALRALCAAHVMHACSLATLLRRRSNASSDAQIAYVRDIAVVFIENYLYASAGMFWRGCAGSRGRGRALPAF
ncbi:hypothetical protein EON68_00150 [archaeon]|nr:MAG: hypothetical protein EON68_00150 [archaeon]